MRYVHRCSFDRDAIEFIELKVGGLCMFHLCLLLAEMFSTLRLSLQAVNGNDKIGEVGHWDVCLFVLVSCFSTKVAEKSIFIKNLRASLAGADIVKKSRLIRS